MNANTALTIGSLVLSSCFALPQVVPGNPAQARIQKEVRHELATLPYYTVFDSIEYQVVGDRVVLSGYVTRPTIKSDAENVLKHIEGVSGIDNRVEVLPLSTMDDQLRIATFRAIYGFPSLEKYSLGIQKPIRVIVKNGQITLTGVVDTQSDKDTAGLRANAVPNAFSVTNNLRVVPR
jgi:hyperosmotically inducible protein